MRHPEGSPRMGGKPEAPGFTAGTGGPHITRARRMRARDATDVTRTLAGVDSEAARSVLR